MFKLLVYCLLLVTTDFHQVTSAVYEPESGTTPCSLCIRALLTEKAYIDYSHIQ